MGPKEEKNSPVDKLRAFQRRWQANKTCADCPERGPTYVCLDFQIFVCQSCAGIHREFGHKIKSISFSEWNIAEVTKLEEGGNEAARVKWLDRWTKETFPEPDGTDLEALREFIRLKYVEKKWYRPHAKPAPAAKAQAAPQAVPDNNAAQAPTGTVDLLSGGEATVTPVPPAPEVTKHMAEVPDLLGSLEPSPVVAPLAPPKAPAPAAVEEPWTADFGSIAKVTQAPESTSAYTAGLIDLDFTGGSPPKAAAPKPDEDLMVIDTLSAPLPVEEPAAEPAPTDVEAEDTSASMGEKLRQAVLSGSQDDLKRLFQQCSKLPAKKAVDEKRLAAFSAFDDLLKPDGVVTQEVTQPGSAQPTPGSPTRLASAAEEVQVPSEPSVPSKGPEMFFIGDDSIAEDLMGGMSASAPSAPSAPSSQAQAPVPMALTPELLQQLNSNGVSAKNLTPHQLERMSPQELVQLQAMISSALQARAPPAPAPSPAPSPWQQGGYRPPPVTNRISSFDMAPKEQEAAPFGELLDMFQKKNTSAG